MNDGKAAALLLTVADSTDERGATITMAGQRPMPATSEALRQVRRDAVAAFDRKHPVKELEDF